ncbi:hypothetical protein GCM10011611_26400 [Aliidongia dinghuensis]|uniref:Uncharacterized protein n=1 Tax=Aliidongia dinghuensis TaxID=1867774 RepID=A0A8J3E2A0_9PROT|nr:hypothetical protein [Aliidongia dinghuensis]GGF19234.1 hypothetical protein GCM10011611_26400 [Aliidongia dinghuensis]
MTVAKGIAGAPSLVHTPGEGHLRAGGKRRSRLGRAALFNKHNEDFGTMPANLKKLRIREISLVDRPASPDADVILMKSRGGQSLAIGQAHAGDDFLLVGDENGPNGIIMKHADGTGELFGPDFLTPEILGEFTMYPEARILKFNEHHDASTGRFVSADGGGSSTPASRGSLFSNISGRSVATHGAAAAAGVAVGAVAAHPANRQALMRAIDAGLRHPATQDALRRAGEAARSPSGQKAAAAAFAAATAAAGAGKAGRALGLGFAAGLMHGAARFGKSQEHTSMSGYEQHYRNLLADVRKSFDGRDDGDMVGAQDARSEEQKAAEMQAVLEHAAQNLPSSGEKFEGWLARIFGQGADALYGDERQALAALVKHHRDALRNGRVDHLTVTKAERGLARKAEEIQKAERTTFAKAFTRAATRNPEMYATLRAAQNDTSAADAALDVLNKRAQQIQKSSGGKTSFAKAFGQACAEDPSSYSTYRNRGASAQQIAKADDGDDGDGAQEAADAINARAAEFEKSGLRKAAAFTKACQAMPSEYQKARMGRKL